MIRFGTVTIDRKRRIISNGKKSVRWFNNGRKIEFRLVEALLISGGMTKKQLFHVLYGDDPEGGPLYGLNIISVLLVRLYPKIKNLGLEARKFKHNGYTVHWIASPNA